MELFIKFPDQSQSFTAGVEYGRLFGRIEKGDPVVTNDGFPVRIENKELLQNTCTKYGYTYNFGVEYYGEWIEFTAIKITNSEN
ncbi:Uncharacterised protein [Chryseobacterium gleum]|uniref:Uncharacterized protein n=2 Tax=Chryseobacterium gleum TaxID=250 RepID=A0A448B819_CHRGE|nr:hypothetical protein [Chryseobacterium gleum]EFK36833.1 hypothetical protein HMPREF0204_11390 [Chryseobacterium gleum ATCC 35910]QQY32086.1 hypothetical protein I6I60_25195 [Chryseobacterium gleum]VEE10693.1 Uncharacterised protein [Chryseobacterium gleum]